MECPLALNKAGPDLHSIAISSCYRIHRTMDHTGVCSILKSQLEIPFSFLLH